MPFYTVSLYLPEELDLGETPETRANTVADMVAAYMANNVQGAVIAAVREERATLPFQADADYRVLSATEEAAKRSGITFSDAVEHAMKQTYGA